MFDLALEQNNVSNDRYQSVIELKSKHLHNANTYNLNIGLIFVRMKSKAWAYRKQIGNVNLVLTRRMHIVHLGKQLRQAFTRNMTRIPEDVNVARVYTAATMFRQVKTICTYQYSSLVATCWILAFLCWQGGCFYDV